VRTGEQIKAEILAHFGFFPPFFAPALESPPVLENLWRQTLSAYLDNPLSPLFKEKLNALLSRFCSVPYCMVCHSSALRPLGMSAAEVLALLESRPALPDAVFGSLPVPTRAEAAAPAPDSALEQTLLACASAVFLDDGGAEPGHRELRRLLGPDLYLHLIAYLAYIQTCHTWMEAHPEISYEADKRAQDFLGPLLAEEPALADFFAHYPERIARWRSNQAAEAARADERRQADAALRQSEERLRLLVDGAQDYAMILMDAEGCVTHWNAGAQRILGYPEAEVMGRPCDLIFTPEDRAAGVPAREMETAREGGMAPDERWHLRQDGGRFWADGVLECLRGEDGALRGFAKILRDDTERRLAGEALSEANRRTADILESVTDAFYAFDAEWRFTYVNAHAARLLQRASADLLGRVVWDEFPEAVGTKPFTEYRRAVAEQVPVAFEEFYVPLATWFEVRAYPSPKGLAVYFHDISARKVSEAALREALARTEDTLESIGDAFYALDADFRLTYVNRKAEEWWGIGRADLIGRHFWTTFPKAVGGLPYDEHLRAMAQRTASHFEAVSPLTGKWIEISIYPGASGLSVYFRDISARKESEAALRVSERRFRHMADAIPHIAWTTDADGVMDYYNQRWYDYSGLDFEETQGKGWRPAIHPDDHARANAAWRASRGSGTVAEVEYRLRRADGVFRWHLGRSEPVRDESGQVIQWVGTATDIEERRRAEDERERLLTEAEARAEREGLLNRIAVALRASTDPDTIQRLAAAALGSALGADRCFFAACEEARDLSVVSQEWHRDGLAPLAGAYPLSDYAPVLDSLRSGRTLVVRDVRTEPGFAAVAPTLERLGLRAAVRVPLFDDGVMVGLLGVALAGGPRDWTLAEVSLVEAVAAQTRTAVEAARLRLREHNIATQLQEALRPALPGAVPGLALRKYHEAAMAEAEVGGDFYDVFPVEKGCTALVVGDLSGKGLAAAVQVATVRNMLRATLYLGESLSGAVTDLNNILAENGLLTGFATLFVGTYDSGSGTLTYVNCGQEPGLVRRAGRGPEDAGRVEELLPTGPVLGTFADALFEERTVLMAPGDALALFTDGLTEAGPDHKDMLGIEGVSDLLAAARPHSGAVSADHRAEDFLLRLIAGVDQFAQAGVRDDVCLLVAVVEG